MFALPQLGLFDCCACMLPAERYLLKETLRPTQNGGGCCVCGRPCKSVRTVSESVTIPTALRDHPSILPLGLNSLSPQLDIGSGWKVAGRGEASVQGGMCSQDKEASERQTDRGSAARV